MTSDKQLAILLTDQLFSNALAYTGLIEDPRVMLTQMNDLLVKVLEKY